VYFQCHSNSTTIQCCAVSDRVKNCLYWDLPRLSCSGWVLNSRGLSKSPAHFTGSLLCREAGTNVRCYRRRRWCGVDEYRENWFKCWNQETHTHTQYMVISEIYIFKENRYNYLSIIRAGRSGDRIPVGARFFAHVQTSPGAPPSLLYNGYRVFSGGKAAGAWCWPPTPS
jgi:hypothetical protein